MLANLGQLSAQVDQDLGRHTLTLPDQSEQNVFGADVAVTEFLCLRDRQQQQLRGPRRERLRLVRGEGPSGTEGFGNLAPSSFKTDSQRVQCFGRYAFTLSQKAGQQVLRPDEAVME